jgi:hypothetical protein
LTPPNPIEQRLALIEEEWFSFSEDPNARMARWRMDGDGIKMVEVFLESQTVEGSAVTDFFMRLFLPFSDPARHGLELREGFIAEIAAAADEMREAGVDPAWPVPPVDPALDDIGQLLTCVHAFSRHYGDITRRVVVVLMQSEIAHPALWVAWLERLLQRLPEHVRFMVFDTQQAPLLDELAHRYPVQVRTLAPELDMPGAMDALVRQVGGSAPADVYRRMFVGMSTAAQRGNIGGALALAASAIAVAGKQDWIQQVSVVHMACGSLLLGAGRIDDALSAFRAGGAAAAESAARGDPGSDKVVAHSKLAEGNALLQSEDYEAAAAAYEEAVAAVEAQSVPDTLLLIESRRMAAHCRERAARPDLAWTHLGAALQAGEGIEADQRNSTTLPYAAQALLRLASHPAASSQYAIIEQRVVQLLGPEWRMSIPESMR